MNLFTLYLIIGTAMMLWGFRPLMKRANELGITSTWKIVLANMANVLLWPANAIAVVIALYKIYAGGKK